MIRVVVKTTPLPAWARCRKNCAEQTDETKRITNGSGGGAKYSVTEQLLQFFEKKSHFKADLKTFRMFLEPFE